MDAKPDLKTTAGRIADLHNRTAEAPDSAARHRVESLLDEGSFVEIDALARHRSTDFGREHDRPVTDGVVTGYGTVAGRKVCVFSQDITVFDGTLGEVFGEKLTKVYDLAIKTGTPIVGMYESAGPRVQEGIVTLAMYAQVMARITEASGLIPQVSVIFGETRDMAQFPPAMADIVIGGAGAHLPAESDDDAVAATRSVLGYLPQNNRAEVPRTNAEISHGSIADRITDSDRELNDIVPDDAHYDMREVVEKTVDADSFLELTAADSPNMLTGFARIEGRCVGLVANQPLSSNGEIDDAGAEKAARFIRVCDAFNIPIIEFVDSAGVTASARRASKLAFAFAEATVGKVTVITRRAVGPAYVFMGAKDLGADLAYAWPTATIAVADNPAAEIYCDDATAEQEEELAHQFLHPYAAAERGLIDAVIEPAATRGYLIESLRLVERKIHTPQPKKHGNIAL